MIEKDDQHFNSKILIKIIWIKEVVNFLPISILKGALLLSRLLSPFGLQSRGSPKP
jgi:hypothetical protein